jgi:hypothetical protein
VIYDVVNVNLVLFAADHVPYGDLALFQIVGADDYEFGDLDFVGMVHQLLEFLAVEVDVGFKAVLS